MCLSASVIPIYNSSFLWITLSFYKKKVKMPKPAKKNGFAILLFELRRQNRLNEQDLIKKADGIWRCKFWWRNISKLSLTFDFNFNSFYSWAKSWVPWTCQTSKQRSSWHRAKWSSLARYTTFRDWAIVERFTFDSRSRSRGRNDRSIDERKFRWFSFYHSVC